MIVTFVKPVHKDNWTICRDIKTGKIKKENKVSSILKSIKERYNELWLGYLKRGLISNTKHPGKWNIKIIDLKERKILLETQYGSLSMEQL